MANAMEDGFEYFQEQAHMLQSAPLEKNRLLLEALHEAEARIANLAEPDRSTALKRCKTLFRWWPSLDEGSLKQCLQDIVHRQRIEALNDIQPEIVFRFFPEQATLLRTSSGVDSRTALKWLWDAEERISGLPEAERDKAVAACLDTFTLFPSGKEGIEACHEIITTAEPDTGQTENWESEGSRQIL